MQRSTFHQPTDEMRRWAVRLRSLLRPGSVLGIALVTPIAHVANRSLFFQTYLYAVFHRTLGARLSHAVLMPGIVLLALTALAMWSTAAAWLATAAMLLFHLDVARRHGVLLAGWLTATLLLLLGAIAVYAAATWDPRFGQPWMWAIGLGLLQTLSHAAEEHVPPRVSGNENWVRTSVFFARTPVRSVVRASLMVPAGLLNELWASWRLLPVLVLDTLWRCGYQQERAEQFRRVVEDAWSSGNPAIDFLGSGGATCAPSPS